MRVRYGKGWKEWRKGKFVPLQQVEIIGVVLTGRFGSLPAIVHSASYRPGKVTWVAAYGGVVRRVNPAKLKMLRLYICCRFPIRYTNYEINFNVACYMLENMTLSSSSLGIQYITTFCQVPTFQTPHFRDKQPYDLLFFWGGEFTNFGGLRPEHAWNKHWLWINMKRNL